MSETIKTLLCALIDSLAKTKYCSQYDEGEKILDEKGMEILKDTIRKL